MLNEYVFNILTLIGGLCLFLFGMNIMGQALERRAGSGLTMILGKLTNSKCAGLLTGLGVTAVIQSSSATTVMVVGFVNSGIMTLKQAINVIMGANIGTTVTAWILSLGGIEGDNIFVQLLKPSSFTPVLALIGIVFYMFLKNDKKKDTGLILLGFATLMFGMETMSDAVSFLEDVPEFGEILLLFTNPALGVLAGAILTAIIQSSSASVGILQALSATGKVSVGAAIPIIMGQNIGTCITAVLSSVGATKNAKRTALVHLMFNVIGTAVWLVVFVIIKAVLAPVVLLDEANHMNIAVIHSAFNILCTLLLLPMGGLLEKLVIKLVPDSKTPESYAELDERLLEVPAVAMEHSRALSVTMAATAFGALKDSIKLLKEFSPEVAASIRAKEEKTDHYEDVLGTYLVKLSSCQISSDESAEAAKLLKIIGDFERISDYAVGIVCSAEEMAEKKLKFSPAAAAELEVLTNAVIEILEMSFDAFVNDDLDLAMDVEPLEQVIDARKEELRMHHILRLQQGECSIGAGFVWTDLLTSLARTSDHCSNIAGCIIDQAHNNMNIHESIRGIRNGSQRFCDKFDEYSKKYALN